MVIEKLDDETRRGPESAERIVDLVNYLAAHFTEKKVVIGEGMTAITMLLAKAYKTVGFSNEEAKVIITTSVEHCMIELDKQEE